MIAFMDTFGIYIAKRREELGYSQRKLAQLVGLSHATISKIETGISVGFKFTTFLSLAKALKVKASDLIEIYEGRTEKASPASGPVEDDQNLWDALETLLERRKNLQ